MRKFEILIMSYELGTDTIADKVYQEVHECKSIAAAKELADEKYHEWATHAGFKINPRLYASWTDGEIKGRADLKQVFKSGRVKKGDSMFKNSVYVAWKKQRRKTQHV